MLWAANWWRFKALYKQLKDESCFCNNRNFGYWIKKALSSGDEERHKELIAIVEKKLPLDLNQIIELAERTRNHYRELYENKEVELKVELQDAKDQLKIIYIIAKPYAD